MDTGHLSRPPGAFLESNDNEDQLALLNYVRNKKLKNKQTICKCTKIAQLHVMLPETDEATVGDRCKRH